MGEPASRHSWPCRLTRLELVGGAVGAGTGLIAAAPLLWLAAEAHRVNDAGLSPAARFRPWELLVLWGAGALIGAALAAWLTRAFVRLSDVQRLHWGQHLLHLFAGAVLIIVVAPALPGLLLARLTPGGNDFLACYLVGGTLVGWQSGVIAYVFLYTFRMLDHLRNPKERS
jgi:hypothetical protein